MISMITFSDRSQWLQGRSKRIGGSDAASIIGLNPWRSNLELYEIKAGIKEQEDISSETAVKYGTEAEQYLRELFKLDYPQMRVGYKPDNLWTNTEYPWAHASLDGWMVDPQGRRGVLEIKTTTIQNAQMKEKWRDKIPNYYYAQVLHYLAVVNADFAILKAQLKYDLASEEPFCMVKHYRIERADVIEDITYLMEQEARFAECVENMTPPPLVLPPLD